MQELSKPFKTCDEQLAILRSRGMCIPDPDDARQKLLVNNYYMVINGYKTPFVVHPEPENGERYIDGTTFDEVFALYEFDNAFRALLLKYILRVEHKLKSVISYIFAGAHKDIRHPDYLDEACFEVPGKNQRQNYLKMKQHIEKELNHQRKNNNPMLKHYENTYHNIPPWILVSIISFGMLRIFYCSMRNSEKNEVARRFNLRPNVLEDYLSALNTYRNACAHDERIYDTPLHNSVCRGSKQYKSVYIIVLILKDMLDAASFQAFYAELDACIARLNAALHVIPISVILERMGIPAESEIRKADLGLLETGDVFSMNEFREVLRRYILPVLPVKVKLVAVDESDPLRNNPSCALVKYKDGCLYFAQNVLGKFAFRTECADGEKALWEQAALIQEHMSLLINNIHMFWNADHFTSLDRDRAELAFPDVCERAYQLTICSMMCKGLCNRATRAYEKAEMRRRREEGTATSEHFIQLQNEVRIRSTDRDNAALIQNSAQRSLYRILSQLEQWAGRTYEGQHKTFGIILNKEQLPPTKLRFNYIDFLKSDFSATINDGQYSAVELYADGSFRTYTTIKQSKNDHPSIPYPFTGFAHLCTHDKVGVLLTSGGDIMLINDGELRFTKRGGSWCQCNAHMAITCIQNVLKPFSQSKAKIIYQTIADLSYSRGGACIGILNADEPPKELAGMIDAGCLLAPELDDKRRAIRDLIHAEPEDNYQSFYDLDRYLRRELLELDGAMVFSKSGLIHVVGTIIRLDASGSSGGGRTAAAKQLSKFGLGIKISQDGYVQFFKNGEVLLEIMT